MQISVKTPPELSLPLLEKCAAIGEDSPSHFMQDCVWQCVRYMESPHLPFHPLGMVEKYYRALGREDELLTGPTKKKDEFLDRLADQDRKKRARESAHRLAEFHRLTKTRPKHLHLKLSQGMGELQPLERPLLADRGGGLLHQTFARSWQEDLCGSLEGISDFP
jgi:hypothetical protein